MILTTPVRIPIYTAEGQNRTGRGFGVFDKSVRGRTNRNPNRWRMTDENTTWAENSRA